MKKLWLLFLISWSFGLFAQITELHNLELDKLQALSDPGTVSVNWTCDFGENRYSNEFFIIEYTQDVNFEKPSRFRIGAWKTADSLNLSTTISGLEKGTWFIRVAFAFGWEVYDITAYGSPDGFTATGNVNVMNGYTQPKMLLPSGPITEKEIVLSWIESETIDRYFIQIADNIGFHDPIDITCYTFENRNKVVDLSRFKPGTLDIRIQGELPGNELTRWSEDHFQYAPVDEHIYPIVWVTEKDNTETYLNITVLNDALITNLTVTFLPDKTGTLDPQPYSVTLQAYQGEVFLEQLQDSFPFPIGKKPGLIVSDNPIYATVNMDTKLYGDVPIYMPLHITQGFSDNIRFPQVRYDEFHRISLVVSNFDFKTSSAFNWALYWWEAGNLRHIEGKGGSGPLRAWTLDLWEDRKNELPESFVGWFEIENLTDSEIDAVMSIKNIPVIDKPVFSYEAGIKLK